VDKGFLEGGFLRLVSGPKEDHYQFPMYNFKKRHAIVVGMCCMCKQNGEFVNHILLHFVRLLVPYGMLSSVALGCLRLCLAGWSICLLVGGQMVALIVLLCGRWSSLAFCGVLGEKETIETSRTRKARWRILIPTRFLEHHAKCPLHTG
jgi:hypothetical protein